MYDEITQDYPNNCGKESAEPISWFRFIRDVHWQCRILETETVLSYPNDPWSVIQVTPPTFSDL